MMQSLKFWTALSLLVLMGAWITGVVLTGIWNAVAWVVGVIGG
jgi:hypothetical protein